MLSARKSFKFVADSNEYLLNFRNVDLINWDDSVLFDDDSKNLVGIVGNDV